MKNMPSIEPLKHYLNALEILASGDQDGAARELEAALGAGETEEIRANIATLLNRRELAGEVMLDLIRVEASKGLGASSCASV